MAVPPKPLLDQQATNLLADALQRHEFSDWYHALLLTALEEVHDVETAIALADKVYANHPRPTAETTEEYGEG